MTMIIMVKAASESSLLAMLLLGIFHSFGIRSDAICHSPQYLEIRQVGTIDCSLPTATFDVLWYNTTDYLRNDPIVHYRNQIKTGVGYDSGEFDVDANGSLIITKVSLQHDHTFKVVYVSSEGEVPVVTNVRVVVIIYPVPKYPTVDGCSREQYCVLPAENEGNLTCRVEGIRPQVELEWNTIYNKDAAWITFANQQSTVEDNAGIFDVTLTSAYSLNSARKESLGRLTIECKVTELYKIFHLRSEVELLFAEGDINSTEQILLPTSRSQRSWVVPVIVVVILLSCVSCGIIIVKGVCTEKKLETEIPNSEEINPMMRETLRPDEEKNLETVIPNSEEKSPKMGEIRRPGKQMKLETKNSNSEEMTSMTEHGNRPSKNTKLKINVPKSKKITSLMQEINRPDRTKKSHKKLRHEDFRYLTSVEMNELHTQPLKHVQFVNETLARPKFEQNAYHYSLKRNSNLKMSDDKDELHIVLLGKTGSGKSATGNTILGEEVFTHDANATSVTKKSTCIERTIQGRKIMVMDTPGLHDTHRSNNDIFKEIARVTAIFPRGVHAFLYVRNISDTRFTKEDNVTFELIEKGFGGEVKSFRILVYTYAQSQLQDKTLDEYCSLQKEDKTQSITHFLEELNGNIVAVENKSTVPAEQERNQNAILALVDKVKREHDGKLYTSAMFNEALEAHRKLQEEAARKGWSPELMNAVEMVIAADPDIVTRKVELGQKVYECQLKKREDALRQKFNDEMEKKMADIEIENRRIMELLKEQEQTKLMLRKDEQWKEEILRVQREKNELEKRRKKAEYERKKEMALIEQKIKDLKVQSDQREIQKEAEDIAKTREGFLSGITDYCNDMWDWVFGQGAYKK